MTYSEDLTEHLLDCGKRASEIINTYVVGMNWDDIKNSFIAIRISDGGSDGVLYDSMRDAAQHQLHEQSCYYFCFRNAMGGVNPRDMAILIKFARDAYYRGFRLIDPDDALGGKQVIMTAPRMDSIVGRYRGVRL